MVNNLNNNFEFQIEPVGLEGSEYENSNLFGSQYTATIGLINRIIDDESRTHYEKNNIIAFIGDRGSGKTSSLLSTKNYIEQIYNKQNIKHKIYVIDQIIDPSNFTNISNIMHLFMSRLFNEYLYISNYYKAKIDYEGDGLAEKFAKMQEILNFEGKKSFEENDPYSSLIECSDYTNVKKELEGLISDFLDFVNNSNDYRNEKNKSSSNPDEYTEVALFIDDIDLNSKHCFEMMEQIRRNMKINKLMIFLAFKWESFEDVILKNYYSDYEVLLKYSADKNLSLKLEEMTKNYMVKFIPLNYRVYLPSTIEIIGALKSAFEVWFKNFYWNFSDNSYYSYFLGKNLREINQRASIISKIIKIDDKNDAFNALENYVKVVYNRNLKNIDSIKFKDIIFTSNEKINEEVIVNIFSIIRQIPSRKNYDDYALAWKNILGDKIYFVKEKKINKFVDILSSKAKMAKMNYPDKFFSNLHGEYRKLFQIPYLLYGIDSLSLSIVVNEVNKCLNGEKVSYKGFMKIFRKYLIKNRNRYERALAHGLEIRNCDIDFLRMREMLVEILLYIDLSAKEFEENFLSNTKEITTKQIEKRYLKIEDFIADVKNLILVNVKTYNEFVKSRLYLDTFSDTEKNIISKKAKKEKTLIDKVYVLEDILKNRE